MTFLELQPVLDKLDAADKRRAAAFLINQLRSGDIEFPVHKARRSRVVVEDDAPAYAGFQAQLSRI